MLYLLTFCFFIGYLIFLCTMVWIFIRRFLAPRLEATHGEALAIFYMTIIISLVLLILVNYYTGFLSEIYEFFDEMLFGGQYTGRPKM